MSGDRELYTAATVCTISGQPNSSLKCCGRGPECATSVLLCSAPNSAMYGVISCGGNTGSTNGNTAIPTEKTQSGIATRSQTNLERSCVSNSHITPPAAKSIG